MIPEYVEVTPTEFAIHAQLVNRYGDNVLFYFWRSKSPLSQWYKCTFEHDGIHYNCAEQWMMAQKARLFNDERALIGILRSTEPKEQKLWGQQVHSFDSQVWLEHRWSIVKQGNELKFSQNEPLRKYLLTTKGHWLVEASPNDVIWGIGAEGHDQAAQHHSTWRGANLLGSIQTVVRDEFLGISYP